jgi:hypothetical protein
LSPACFVPVAGAVLVTRGGKITLLNILSGFFDECERIVTIKDAPKLQPQQVVRLPDSRRRVVSLQETTGMEGDMVTMQEEFGFWQAGVATSGVVGGSFVAAGIHRRFWQRLQARGVALPAALFAAASWEGA